ncbi:MAG: hypothetical protein HQ568_05425 [Calditrichaeota bacterium]|nr:hypothetical protein [Calditrichota bacterium]
MKKITALLAFLLLASNVTAKPKTAVRWPIENHQLTVRFDIEKNSIEGTAKLTLPRPMFGGIKNAGFILNKDFTISNASIGGVPVKFASKADYKPADVTPHYGVFGDWDNSNSVLWSVKIPKKGKKAKPLILQVDFKGTLYAPVSKQQFTHEKVTSVVNGTISKDGVYLSPSAVWYPTLPDVLSPYQITITLPEGWSCITDGKQTDRKESDGFVEFTFTSEVVSQGLALSAGPYVVEKLDHNGVQIMTYFLPEQAELAKGYLEASANFIDMYSELITPYPFPTFAVVDNFMPTGYGMPGWTLLGSEVIRLPFIKSISLGHEIVHTWLGNSLYVDYREGNWCEALTVYLSDYKYKEDVDSSAAMEYRMNVLRDFDSYVNEENDYPVSEFVSRSNSTDRSIGYGKGMMIFHMLRKMLDQDDTAVFMQVIRETYQQYQWQPIGWSTWAMEFERRLGRDLRWFFSQWLDAKGALEISIENVDVYSENGRWEVGFEVVTKTIDDKPFKYMLKIRSTSTTDIVEYQPFIQEARQGVKLAGGGDLRTIQLDPTFDVFRKIYPQEVPLTLAKFYGDPEGILVIPSKGQFAARYRQVAESLKSDKQRVITDNELTSELEKHSLWLLGNPADNSAWEKFKPDPTRLDYLPYRAARWKEEEPMLAGLVFRRDASREGKLSATMIDLHPFASDKSIVYSLILPQTDPVSATRKLKHYGKYSFLKFDGDTNKQKGLWVVAGQSPVAWISPD